jgi:hypothetical protein
MTHTSLGAPRLTWRARVQNAFAVVLLATLAIGAAGCSSKDSSTGPTNLNVAGEYLLETIQTKSVPVKIYDGPIGNPRDGVTITGHSSSLSARRSTDDAVLSMMVDYARRR